MKFPNLNVFAAWFFMIQTVAMGWVAATGGLFLTMISIPAQEGDIPSRLVGALLLLMVIYLVWHFMRGLPPKGVPEVSGFLIGHRILLAGNLMAASLFIFHFFAPGIESYNLHLVLNKFTTAFGYLAMGCFAIGFSLVYQSSMPQESR